MISFEHIYNEHFKKVFNLILSYVQHTEDAEEVCQDVFIKVHREMHQFEERSKLSTWIYRIAINTSLDHLRYKSRAKRKAFFLPIFSRPSEANSFEIPDFYHPGIAIEKQELSRYLYGAINLLPENQKTAFILCFLEEMPQREVADIMQLNLKALESLLQRAKLKLRNLLENEYVVQRKKNNITSK